MSAERWAIDANIIVQSSTVRLIAGSVEATQAELLVPERALELAAAKHFAIAGRRASRVIEHALNPEQYTATHLRETTIACTVAIRDAFATWAGTETHLNDGLWTLAPDCEQAEALHERLSDHGSRRDKLDRTRSSFRRFATSTRPDRARSKARHRRRTAATGAHGATRT